MSYPIALALVAALPALAPPASAQSVRKASITVSQPWSRATAPRTTTGAGFLTIHNHGAQADRLVSASSPRAQRVELHTMSMQGGVMRMRPLANGLEVPAKGRATFSPGGNHIMLVGLKRPLKLGERVPATLRFARAGTIDVVFTVAGAGAAGPLGVHREHR